MIKKHWTRKLFYLCGLLGALFILLVIIRTQQYKEDTQNVKQIQALTHWEEWDYFYHGEKIDKKQVSQIHVQEEFVMKKQIPESSQNLWLYFYPYHQEIKAYVDGELVYQFILDENMVFGRTPGFGAQFLDLETKENAGKEIEIHISAPYATAAGKIPDFYIGEKSELIFSILGNDIWSSMISFLLFVLGLVMLIGSRVFRGVLKTRELFFLGLFAILFTVWSMMQFPYIQLLIGNRALIMYINYICFELYTIPMLLYIREKFGRKIQKVFNGIVIFAMCHFVFSVIAQIVGICDIEDTLFVVHMVMLSGVFLAMFFSMYQLKKGKKIRRRKIFLNMGYCFVALCVFGDLIRYYVQRSPNIALYTRVGLIVYVICLGFDYGKAYFEGVECMLETKVLQKMAYTDIMTNLKNRTAYQKAIEEMNAQIKEGQEKQRLAIVLFDLNYLKQINDLHGHSEGDAYIIKAAELIKDCFAGEGACYRIGGDEFAVLMKGKGEQDCRQLVEKFKKNLETRMLQDALLSIACGYAEYTKEDTSIEAAIVRADRKMYEDKTEIKGEEEVR